MLFRREFKQELHLSCAAVFFGGPWRVSASITASCCRAPVAPCSLKHLTCYVSPWIISDGGGLGRKKNGAVPVKWVRRGGRWKLRRGQVKREWRWVAGRSCPDALLTWQKRVHPLPFAKLFCVLIRSRVHTLPEQSPRCVFSRCA